MKFFIIRVIYARRKLSLTRYVLCVELKLRPVAMFCGRVVQPALYGEFVGDLFRRVL
jgi:hypothetical protein